MKNFVRKNSFLQKISFCGLLVLPLNNPDNWHTFKFSNIPANQLKISKGKVQINVKKSASPIIYTLKKRQMISGFNVQASVTGQQPEIRFPASQADKAWDDFVLRFGLIVAGDSRLNWLQRQLAPDWLINMEKLLPKEQGIKEVRFFTTCQQQKLFNKTRKLQFGTKITEICIEHLKGNKKFSLKKKFETALPLIGLWISSDGDQTASEFQLTLDKIELTGS